MRRVEVSTDVFAQIWALRRSNEDTEDAILRRVLANIPAHNNGGRAAEVAGIGLQDPRSGVAFPEGFEVFRTYHGLEYRARVSGGTWVLQNDGRPCRSLNELSRAIGAKSENAWLNWLYIDQEGGRHPVSTLRDPATIATRHRGSKWEMEEHHVDHDDEVDTDGTWLGDVRVALHRLGGKASLYRIYKEVTEIRRAAERSLPRSLEATVRHTLEAHCSQSHNYRGPDFFSMPEGKGAGVWALRPLEP